MKHEWIIKFLNLYIKDPNIIGLVKKYLKVGVLDGGELMMNEEGSAQGNIISPILANIYMHNVLTLWYKFIITKECKGDNFLIVYADYTEVETMPELSFKHRKYHRFHLKISA